MSTTADAIKATLADFQAQLSASKPAHVPEIDNRIDGSEVAMAALIGLLVLKAVFTEAEYLAALQQAIAAHSGQGGGAAVDAGAAVAG